MKPVENLSKKNAAQWQILVQSSLLLPQEESIKSVFGVFPFPYVSVWIFMSIGVQQNYPIFVKSVKFFNYLHQFLGQP